MVSESKHKFLNTDLELQLLSRRLGLHGVPLRKTCNAMLLIMHTDAGSTPTKRLSPFDYPGRRN